MDYYESVIMQQVFIFSIQIIFYEILLMNKKRSSVDVHIEYDNLIKYSFHVRRLY